MTSSCPAQVAGGFRLQPCSHGRAILADSTLPLCTGVFGAVVSTLPDANNHGL